METRQLIEDILDCPITLDHTDDAVVLPTGQTVDKATIYRWIFENQTNPFDISHLIPDWKVIVPNRVHSHISACLNIGDSANGTLLDWLRCPITGEYFNDPVVASDGYTYERDALANYLQKHNNKTPRCTKQTHDLTRQFKQPVYAVDGCIYEFKLIEAYLSKHSGKTPTGDRQGKNDYIDAREDSNLALPRYSNLMVKGLLEHPHIQALIRQDNVILKKFHGETSKLAAPLQQYLKARDAEAPFRFFYHENRSKWSKSHSARQTLRLLNSPTLFTLNPSELDALKEGRLSKAATPALIYLTQGLSA